jgi:hypothetical protein
MPMETNDAPRPNIITDDSNESIANVFCFCALADKNSGIMYHDMTGNFPFMSLDGCICHLVMYHYESNSIQSISAYEALNWPYDWNRYPRQSCTKTAIRAVCGHHRASTDGTLALPSTTTGATTTTYPKRVRTGYPAPPNYSHNIVSF